MILGFYVRIWLRAIFSNKISVEVIIVCHFICCSYRNGFKADSCTKCCRKATTELVFVIFKRSFTTENLIVFGANLYNRTPSVFSVQTYQWSDAQCCSAVHVFSLYFSVVSNVRSGCILNCLNL